jgi:regulatory protein
MPEIEEEKNKAMKFAMKLIGLRRRSESEIRRRLKDKKYGENLIEDVMEELKKWEYLDDEKFAESYINDRINFRPAGKFLIKMELKTKGISEKIINKKLNEIVSDEKELEMAQGLVKKRIDGLDPKDSQKDRVKLMNYLKTRGFSGAIISQAMKNEIE